MRSPVGRSQLATVFAEQVRRGDRVGTEVGIDPQETRPADRVSDIVVEAPPEAREDLSGRKPRAVGSIELEQGVTGHGRYRADGD